MRSVILPNPAAHLSESEPDEIRLLCEEGEYSPAPSTRGVLILSGMLPAEGADLSAQASADILNRKTLPMPRLKSALREISSHYDMETGESPLSEDAARVAAELFRRELRAGAKWITFSDAFEWAGDSAQARGDWAGETLETLADMGNQSGLEALAESFPSHPRLGEMLEKWTTQGPERAAVRAAGGWPKPRKAPSSPRLWEILGEEVRRKAAADLKRPPEDAYGAWLGVNHLPYLPRLAARLGECAPRWSMRMLRCAETEKQLILTQELFDKKTKRDVKRAAEAHRKFLATGKTFPVEIGEDRASSWKFRYEDSRWFLPWMQGRAAGPARSAMAVGEPWGGGAAWLRYGNEAVWAPDCRCSCGRTRGEYLIRGTPHRLENVLAQPFRGEWPEPEGPLRGRDVKIDGDWRFMVENPDGLLREGMRIEVSPENRAQKVVRGATVVELLERKCVARP